MAEITEGQFQSSIMSLARAYGWLVWHCNDSRRPVNGRWVGDSDIKGMPDLIMVPPTRHPRQKVVFMEVKSATGKLTDAQSEALRRLHNTNADAWLVRPDDWATICKLITGADDGPA